MPNNDVASALHAITERVYLVEDKGKFQPPPKPFPHFGMSKEGMLKRRVAFELMVEPFNQAFDRSFSAVYQSERTSPYSIEEFLGNYGGAQLKRYTQAAESLKKVRLGNKDARVALFTKDEYRDWKCVEGKWIPKPPRAIQTRSPRYHVALGTYLDPMEKRLYKILDHMFDPGGLPTVAKGLNLNRRGQVIAQKWKSFADPVGIGLDALRYDQHQGEDLQRNEHKNYRKVSKPTSPDPNIPPLAYLLDRQIHNVGRYKHKTGSIRYSVLGKRMSGDKNTSSGNVTNMLTVFYLYLDSISCRKDCLLNDGDDNTLIVERRMLNLVLETIEKFFLRFGLTMKVEGIFNTLEEIEFCQTHPVQIDGEYKLVPNPHKRLYSDLMTTKNIATPKPYTKWLGSVAGCGASASKGVPIFQAYYQWISTGAPAWRPKAGTHYYRFRDELTEGMESGVTEISMMNRLSFYRAYGMSPAVQVALEKTFSTLPPPGWTIAKHMKTNLPPILNLCKPKWDKPCAPNLDKDKGIEQMREVLAQLAATLPP